MIFNGQDGKNEVSEEQLYILGFLQNALTQSAQAYGQEESGTNRATGGTRTDGISAKDTASPQSFEVFASTEKTEAHKVVATDEDYEDTQSKTYPDVLREDSLGLGGTGAQTFTNTMPQLPTQPPQSITTTSAPTVPVAIAAVSGMTENSRNATAEEADWNTLFVKRREKGSYRRPVRILSQLCCVLLSSLLCFVVSFPSALIVPFSFFSFPSFFSFSLFSLFFLFSHSFFSSSLLSSPLLSPLFFGLFRPRPRRFTGEKRRHS
mgnify:CR=1 FL=1